MAYTKSSLYAATVAWEGLHPAVRYPPPPSHQSREPTHLDSNVGVPAQQSISICKSPPKPNRRQLSAHGARGAQTPMVLAPVPVPAGLDVARLITTLLQAQSEAQLAQANANHANLIAFHTATAQALGAKGGDKDSKLTVAKRRILQACAGISHVNEFKVELVYHEMETEGGSSDALGRILRRRLKPIPLSPHKTNIHITPQLIATVKTFSLSSNGDKTYAGCTKGITIFAVPWRMADAINEDLAEDEYFAATTLKSVTDIRKHVTSAKVELPTSLQGVARVLNNYCRLLDVLFGPDCPHLENVIAIWDALETH